MDKFNAKQLDYEKLIQLITNLDFHQYFKETLLSILNLTKNNLTNEQTILSVLENLINIREEVKIYEINRKLKEVEPALYLLAKEFFRFKSTRSLFYKAIQSDYEREKPSCNWRPFLFIGLFEFFMCNTNEIEINEIFKDNLARFHEFFYTLVFADVSKQYYESNTLLYYFDCEMGNIPGKEFSKFMKLKIQKCIERDDIEEFYKIYQNFFSIFESNDLLELFSVEKTNFIPFLLKNISGTDIIDMNLEFNFYFEKNLDLINSISKTLLNLLPDYKIDDWNDPLYLSGFFDCLTKEHIQQLIKNPNIDFFEILMKYQCTEYLSNNEVLKKFIVEKEIDFPQLCREKIKENNFEKLYWFWDRWLLELLEIDDFKMLLEDPEINFVESLLKAAYLYKHKDEVGFNYQFPSKLKYDLRSLMVKQITQVIKKYEKESFIPLLAMRLFDYYSPQELIDLLQNNEINLLNKINDTIEFHYKEIMELNESFYRWKINFFKFLTKFNIPVSEQIDRVEPGESLIMWLAPSDDEVEDPNYLLDNETELEGPKEYISIAGKKITILKGVLDLSGLNLYNLEDVEGLFELKTIKVLSLSNNFIEKLPDEIGNLTSLEQLIIENCNLKSVPESFGELINIKKINFHRTNLNYLPVSFGNLIKLEILNLSFNKLIELPNSFGTLESLRELNLRNNPDIKLPNSIENLKELELFNVSYTKLNEIPHSFSKLESLKELNLSNNRITMIPFYIQNLKGLEHLDLSHNIRLKKIPDYIGELDFLKVLNLSSSGIVELPNSIGKLKRLEKLYLDKTYINELPESIGELRLLDELSIKIYGRVIKIPESILNCTSLRFLKLNDDTKKEYIKVLSQLKRKRVKSGGWNLRIN